MKLLDRGVAFSTALQLDEILVHLVHSGVVAPSECRDRLSISRGSMLSVTLCCNLTMMILARNASVTSLAWTNLAQLLLQ